MILRMAFLFTAGMLSAAPLRVTTWNIEPKLAAGTNGTSPGYQKNLIKESAEILKNLNPDVILLQGVLDWESCNEMVKALKPAKYNVAAWSSLRDLQTGLLSKQQVTILSKTRAYISWSENWKTDHTNVASGGFAFAAVRIGGKNVGFFSVQIGDDVSPEPPWARAESARQLVAQIASLKNWTTNRVQSLAVAGSINTDDSTPTPEQTLPLLQQAGLVDAFGDLSPAKRITLPAGSRHPDATSDYIFTRNASAAASPEIIPVALTEHYPVTCDLNLESPPATQPLPATPVQVAETPPVKPTETHTVAATTNTAATTPATPIAQAASTAPAPVPAPLHKENFDRQRVAEIAGIAAGGILLIVVTWKLLRPPKRRRRSRRRALLPMRAGDSRGGPVVVMPERIVIAPRHAETTGSAADHPPVVHIETSDADAHVRMWQRRAEEAERRAERATELAKQGLMGHLAEWLKGRLVQRLASDRKQLIDTQNVAAMKMQIVDERLSKIEGQLQSRYRAYEQRITELEKELAEAREENRELIRAKIAQVRAEMEKARAEAQRAGGNLS